MTFVSTVHYVVASIQHLKRKSHCVYGILVKILEIHKSIAAAGSCKLNSGEQE